MYEKLEISDAELNALTNAIQKRYGLDFTNYEKKSLKRGFARLVTKNHLGSLLELWSKVLSNREFFMGSIDELTVNLTELFRNPDAWIKIFEGVLETYKTKPSVNIWHAGCSTGEEVYTMAIVLEDKGLLHKTKTLATDLSVEALGQAKKGTYSKMLLSKYTVGFKKYYQDNTLDSFFIMNGDEGSIHPRYKRHIEFLNHNLVTDPIPGKFDIIFCRNVMIYFDDTLKMNVLKLFFDALNEGGYFIIGYYDMLPEEGKNLFDSYDMKTRIYQKKSNAEGLKDLDGRMALTTFTQR